MVARYRRDKSLLPVHLSFKESRQDSSIRRGDILYLHVSVWHSELWGLLEGIPEDLER